MFRTISVIAILGCMALGVYGGVVLLFPGLAPMVAGLGAVSNVPTQINQQGVVSVGGVRFTGSGQFKFAIVDPGTGNNVWTNDGSQVPSQAGVPTNGVTLTVIDGVYSVALGGGAMSAISPGLFADGNLVLRVWFNDGTHDWQQLSPDQKLTSVPYAFTVADGAITGAKIPSGTITGNHVASGTITADKLASGAATPAGAVQVYAGSTAPAGWLLCDGSAVSRTIYSPLFTVIGAAYGAGDGSTTFNLPDLRGRGVVALDNMGGSDAGRLDVPNSLGGSGGEQKHILTVSEMPAHDHTATAGGSAMDNINYPGAGGIGFLRNFFGQDRTGVTGGGQAHNNMQPYLLMSYIIKY